MINGGNAMNQKIRPNLPELKRLVADRFYGNKSAFARALGVDRGQISKILNDDGGSGALFFGGLLAFCEREHLYFKDYIIMPKNVKIINTTKSERVSDGNPRLTLPS
jgi:hypothetical protein